MSDWQLDTVRRILSTHKGLVSSVVLTVVALAGVLAPIISPYSFSEQDLGGAAQQPSLQHWLGTDEFGRDLLTRIMYGARTSLTVAVVSIGASVVVGVILGAVAAYYGGVLDRIIITIVDLIWSFPDILIALLFIAIVGPGLKGTMIAISVAYLAQFARLGRSQVLSLRGEMFVEAARSLGASNRHVLLKHLVPNAISPVVVAGMLAVGDAIILEATLGFFGLGAQPPIPSWGAMMASGTAQLFNAPWIIIFPGLAIITTVIGINLLGDALIHALNIRDRVRTT